MKKLLVLPGNSIQNRTWGEACGEFFGSQFDSVDVLHYTHWETGEPWINLNNELEKLRDSREKDDASPEWYIFAKSIGTVLALLAVQQKIIVPQQCVFFGMSLQPMSGGYTYLTDFAVPALAFHNDQDPTANYVETAKMIREMAPTIALQTMSGDTHDYLDFARYEPEIKQFLQL
jgi:hypothetical protein